MFRPEAKFGFFLGITGVDLFFMISGFVIFMSLEKSKNAKNFLVSRFIRLFPIYWVITTFTFLLFFILNLFDGVIPYTEISLKTYLVNLSMVQYYFDVPNVSGSYWTLIIELLFYLFVLVIFIFKALRFIVPIGIVINGLIFLLVFLINNYSLADFTHTFPLIYHFPMFFIGILFYKMRLDKSKIVPYILIILPCLFLQLYLADYGRATQFMSLYAYGIMLGIYLIIFLFFILDKLNFIVNSATVYLGEISYSLYLVHQPLSYCLIIPYFTDILKINFWISTLLIAIPVSILVSIFLTYKIEQPLRIYLRKKMIRS